MCAISIVISGIHIVIYNCYMPCDTDHDHDNLTTFNDMLQEISDTSASLDAQHIVIGGDLNTDFRRLTALHTRAIGTYLIREDMKYGLQLRLSEVDYTYQSKINNERSIINHFIDRQFVQHDQ